MRAVYSEPARRDIDDILAKSRDLFGDGQAQAYSELLKKAVWLILENPARPSSLDRSDFFPELRSLHVALAARGKRASHQIFYRVGKAADGVDRLEVIRVLHQSMDAAAHLAEGLRGFDKD